MRLPKCLAFGGAYHLIGGFGLENEPGSGGIFVGLYGAVNIIFTICAQKHTVRAEMHDCMSAYAKMTAGGGEI